MKNQALFSSKDKSEKLKYRLLQFLFSVLRISLNVVIILYYYSVFEFKILSEIAFVWANLKLSKN